MRQKRGGGFKNAWRATCSNGNNMRITLHTAVAAAFLFSCLALSAQEAGMWRAASRTAQSTTGDVALSAEKITINFSNFTMVKVRALDKPEVTALFDVDSNAAGPASLYRMDIPATRKFLHHNSLCGADNTEWMVAYAAGRTLQLVFFSGETPPVFTLDAISNSSDLCGTYTYSR
jgi:hypothetical protein